MIKFKLKQVLNETGISVTELHNLTGISKNTISLMMNEKSKGIQFDTLSKILKATGAKVADLLEEQTDAYHIYVLGANNNYKQFKDFECRKFDYQIWVKYGHQDDYLLSNLSLTVLLFKSHLSKVKTYLHIAFNSDKIDFFDDNLTFNLGPNFYRTFIYAASYLVFSDLLQNVEFGNNDFPSIAYFDWDNLKLNYDDNFNINIPVDYDDRNSNNKEIKGDKVSSVLNKRMLPSISYITQHCPNIEKSQFDYETGFNTITFRLV